MYPNSGILSNPPRPLELGEVPRGAEQAALGDLRTVLGHPGLPGVVEAGPCSCSRTSLSWEVDPEPTPGRHARPTGAAVQGTSPGQLAASRARPGCSPHLWPWNGKWPPEGTVQRAEGVRKCPRCSRVGGSRPGFLKGGVPQETLRELSARLVVTAGLPYWHLLGGGWVLLQATRPRATRPASPPVPGGRRGESSVACGRTESASAAVPALPAGCRRLHRPLLCCQASSRKPGNGLATVGQRCMAAGPWPCC